MKKSELIHHPLQRVWQCTAIERIGWKAGYLLIVFYGSPGAVNVFGPNVEESDAQKIASDPDPNERLRKLAARHGWESTKLDAL